MLLCSCVFLTKWIFWPLPCTRSVPVQHAMSEYPFHSKWGLSDGAVVEELIIKLCLTSIWSSRTTVQNIGCPPSPSFYIYIWSNIYIWKRLLSLHRAKTKSLDNKVYFAFLSNVSSRGSMHLRWNIKTWRFLVVSLICFRHACCKITRSVYMLCFMITYRKALAYVSILRTTNTLHV